MGWTHINGVITVDVMGRTQAEKKYILDTVLDHLPIVRGSERNMSVYPIQKNGHNNSSSCDEFGDETNNLVDQYGDKDRKHGWLATQDGYLIVVDGSLRHTDFLQTLREFNNWLCRLAKRIQVLKVLVEVEQYQQRKIITNANDVFTNMYEYPSWSEEGSKNWCEYLMWNKEKIARK